MKTCAQIREELEGRASVKASGWTVSCSDCSVPLSSQSCWECCGGSPCCCAPLLMTCDFCEIYLEHRREIAELKANGNGHHVTSASERATSPSHPDHSSHLQGGIRQMEKVQFNVPKLWADHHTLKVRAALVPMAGIQEVVASSAFRMVIVSYDPGVTGPDAIAGALAAAGYPVAESGAGVVAQPVPVADGRKDPAWDRLGFRVARSDARDAKK